MKITAGMGTLDDYIPFIEAGAEEIFIGYVPRIWQERFGMEIPLNRREVCYYNVQIGAPEELQILADLVKRYGVPVSIAFNGLHVREEQYPVIAEILEECLCFGFDSVILADPGLLLYLNEVGLTERLKLHLSGEFGEINHLILRELRSLGIRRLIFHRKTTLSDMEEIIRKMKEPEVSGSLPPMEFEAFLLNENCHFHGGYCNSLHCDELVPMCRMPYRLAGPDGMIEPAAEEKEENGPDAESENGCFYDYGIKHLAEMKRIGITHLKVVGRGANTEDMIAAIQYLKSYTLDTI